ncbi:hypothetical protein TGME49_285740 [Toxoplasma gondii ME49]|uniref:Transmembrane protein n=1 Tax=Toxoplasma gondii (strain ATCC 50611 / Me49) TaxID=508771 RepID=S8FBP2_TOXGM|nr:hypothetical protein TGME49_285740 [Toxoplasma gondii ME49]EPT31083.1 hypothetical protein TGME49_285740 [Toxoplasma gondii ME49]|eukprot:XP_002369212.1 hypothetical protein TGME49_285740 [Toxoplasma gondii ME49]
MPRKKTCSAFDNAPTFSVHAVWPKIECLRLGSRCRKKRNCSRALVSSSSAKLFLSLKNAAFRKGVRPCRTLLSPISSLRRIAKASMRACPYTPERSRTGKNGRSALLSVQVPFFVSFSRFRLFFGVTAAFFISILSGVSTASRVKEEQELEDDSPAREPSLFLSRFYASLTNGEAAPRKL